MRMLIVEDEFTSRSILGRILSVYGDVDIAVDGEEALDALSKARANSVAYDVVFLDVMMPGLSGHDVLAKIREHEKKEGVTNDEQLKVVMTTAAGGKEHVLSAFRARVEAYLTKPLNRTKVEGALAKLGFEPVE